MMQHAPSSSRLLTPILARGVPNIVLPRSVQCTYLRALFRIAESPRAIAIRDTILAAVVQHLVCLDVEIRWQDITFSPGQRGALFGRHAGVYLVVAALAYARAGKGCMCFPLSCHSCLGLSGEALSASSRVYQKMSLSRGCRVLQGRTPRETCQLMASEVASVSIRLFVSCRRRRGG